MISMILIVCIFIHHLLISRHITYPRNKTDCLNGGYTPIFTDKLLLEEALLFSKTTLENNLKANLNLVRVSAPLFVTRASGFNDNLNGVERPATFEPRDLPGIHLEVPFSLAKWKRWALHYYKVEAGRGIVTDFRGLRKNKKKK